MKARVLRTRKPESVFPRGRSEREKESGKDAGPTHKTRSFQVKVREKERNKVEGRGSDSQMRIEKERKSNRIRARTKGVVRIQFPRRWEDKSVLGQRAGQK